MLSPPILQVGLRVQKLLWAKGSGCVALGGLGLLGFGAQSYLDFGFRASTARLRQAHPAAMGGGQEGQNVTAEGQAQEEDNQALPDRFSKLWSLLGTLNMNWGPP